MSVLHITAESPDDALEQFVRVLEHTAEHGEVFERESRNGPTREWNGICVTEYIRPYQRVSFDPSRDCNPFFHLIESFHMLAGRDDLATLVYFNSNMSQYSDDGKFIRGSAYGRRWRSWFGHDQLNAAAEEFARSDDTRRVVVQQWDGRTDQTIDSKDVPCNIESLFLKRRRLGREYVDLTVYNRSNDAIYGAYGANAVHFAFLHEYFSALVGMKPGRYFQVSNCAHVYLENPVYQRVAEAVRDQEFALSDPYHNGEVRYVPLIGEGETVEMLHADLEYLFEHPGPYHRILSGAFSTNFFRVVVFHMIYAWDTWKTTKDAEAAALYLDYVVSTHDSAPPDWLVAGRNWMTRRIKG